MRRIKIWKKSVCLGLHVKSKLSVIISILGVFAAFIPVCIALSLADFTDKIQLLYTNNTFIFNVLKSLGVLLSLYFLQEAFSAIQNYYVKEDSLRIKKYVKEKMMIYLSEVQYKYIENYDDFREKVEFVNKYAGEKTVGSISQIFKWMANVISFISIVILLRSINIWIVIILVVTCFPAAILAFLQNDETYRMRTKWIKEGALTIHYSDICRQNDAIKEIRYWGLYKYIKGKWRDLSQKYISIKRGIIKKHLKYNCIADLLRNGVYLFVVLLVVSKIYKDSSKGLSVFMLVISASSQLQHITTEILLNAISIITDVKYMQVFFEIIENEQIEKKCMKMTDLDDIEISFDNVSFRYPGSDKKALDEINVNIKQGEKIAIVGLNGSGKSTFVNLLCGFFEPDEGNITINGNNIKKIKNQFQSVISVIFQKFCQYQDTLKNNITISDIKNGVNNDYIKRLMDKMGLDGLVNSEESLNEMIGIFADDGRNLSGGTVAKTSDNTSII